MTGFIEVAPDRAEQESRAYARTGGDLSLGKRTEAAVLRTADGPFELGRVRLAEPNSDEVVVSVRACGICHMDIEATSIMPLPCVLGHEGAGIVEEVGSAVTSVRPGDKVILGYGFCGVCPSCVSGRPYHCDRSWELSFSGRRMDRSATVYEKRSRSISAAFFQQSAFSRHVLTPARGLVRVADDIPWSVCAGMPCGVMTGVGAAVNVLGAGADRPLLVFGAGAVGLGAVMAAANAGSSPILVVDVLDDRLELALELGATHAHNADDAPDVTEWVKRHIARGLPLVLEASGNPTAFDCALQSVATGGHIAYAMLPMPMEQFEFRPFPLFSKAVRFEALSFGSAVSKLEIPRMIEWWRSGRFPVERLVEEFAFKDINAAMDRARSRAVIKPVLVF